MYGVGVGGVVRSLAIVAPASAALRVCVVIANERCCVVYVPEEADARAHVCLELGLVSVGALQYSLVRRVTLLGRGGAVLPHVRTRGPVYV